MAENKSPRACLVEALDRAGLARKVHAADHGVTEQQFSKMISGHGASYDIDHLDALPLDVLCDLLERYGQERGFHVERLNPEALAGEVLAALDELVRTYRLAQVQRRPAKAALRAPEPARRVS